MTKGIESRGLGRAGQEHEQGSLGFGDEPKPRRKLLRGPERAEGRPCLKAEP